MHSRTSRRLAALWSLAALLGHALLPAAAPAASAAAVTAPTVKPALSEAAQARARQAFADLPLRFERNQGQLDSRVRFSARFSGFALFLNDREAVLRLQSDQTRAAVIRMRLIAANGAAVVAGEAELPGRSNYLMDSDPARWRTQVSSFARVVYKNVYRGVDMVYYGNGRELEYDFKVAVGANPAAIGWRVSGAKRMRLGTNGALVMATEAGEVRQHRPVAYQEIAGQRRAVAARYVLRGKGEVRFALGRYDRRRPLVIDPVLSYATFLGGNQGDRINAIAVDAAGNAYVTGYTGSPDFPVVNSITPFVGLSSMVFVSKLAPAGNALVYSTFISAPLDPFHSSSTSVGLGIAVDATGSAYVTGQTNATTFPTTPSAFQSARGGNPISPINDAFVLKLDPAGSALVYSTYLGGTNDDAGKGIAIDNAGNAYITGQTSSDDFPTQAPLQPVNHRVPTDAFVTKLNANGTGLVYSTFLGGTGDESGNAIAVDAAGNAYVTGSTVSPDFPTANALQPVYSGRGTFASSDDGNSWSPVSDSFPITASIWSIAVDPVDPAVIYLGTDFNGLFKSTDGGASWAAIDNGIGDLTDEGLPGFYWPMLDLAIDPNHPSTLFTCSFDGVFKSTDGGGHWQSKSFGSVVAIDPTNSLNVYAADASFGLFVSTDGGESWDQSGAVNPSSRIRAIAIAPTSPATVYVGNALGVVRLPGGGASSTATVPSQVRSLAVDPSSPTTVYAGTNGGVYKTTDGGSSWAQMNAGMINALVLSVAVDPRTPSTVYAGTTGGLFKSTDGGASWAFRSDVPNRSINDIAFGQGATPKVYAGALLASDLFVSKLNAAGSALVFSTFVGGIGTDSGLGIALDAEGSLYVTGYTASPTITGLTSARPYAGSTDAFVLKLSAAGAVTYFTDLGSSGFDQGNAIVVDTAGNACVTGNTNTPDFPTTPASIPVAGGACANCIHAFVTQLNAAGTALLYSTYLGGNTLDQNLIGVSRDTGLGVALDPAGNIYVAGQAFATDFPVTAGAFDTTYNGSGDGFVAKIAFPCSPVLEATSAAFTARGGSGSVKVSATGGCDYQAVSNVNWITVVSAARGTGSDAVNFMVRENAAGQGRSGTLTIGGQPFTVNQAGAGDDTCQVGISPGSAVQPASGGSGSVAVSAGPACAWAAQSKASWITITSAASGMGSGVVGYTVAANPNSTARKATIRIGQQTFAVKQRGR